MKLKPTNRMLAAAGFTLASMFGAVAAQAELITTWTWENEAAWVSFAPLGDVTPSGNSGGPIGGATVLSWGVPIDSGNGNQSSLEVEAQTTGTITTGIDGLPGSTETGSNIIHNNERLKAQSAGGTPSLTSAVLVDVLRLTAATPDNGAFEELEAGFVIAFRETPNSDDPCEDGSANEDNPNGCGDILVLENADLLIQKFVVDEYVYTVTLGAQGLGPLSDSACDAAGQANGCIGWVTNERESNQLNPFFTITSALRQVSAPGTLALLGLGLAGLGMSTRRKAK
jgi:hypothetical protein